MAQKWQQNSLMASTTASATAAGDGSEMAAKQSDGINDGVSNSGRQHRGSDGDG